MNQSNDKRHNHITGRHYISTEKQKMQSIVRLSLSMHGTSGQAMMSGMTMGFKKKKTILA